MLSVLWVVLLITAWRMSVVWIIMPKKARLEIGTLKKRIWDEWTTEQKLTTVVSLIVSLLCYSAIIVMTV